MVLEHKLDGRLEPGMPLVVELDMAVDMVQRLDMELV